MITSVTPDTLKHLMDIDHVIRVHADGTVTDAPGVYAPDLFLGVDAGGQALPDADDELYLQAEQAGGWGLLSGYTGQYGYSGPVMHSSEYVGGSLAEDILATPGEYVAVLVECLGSDADGEQEPVGWAIAFREAEHVDCAACEAGEGMRHTPEVMTPEGLLLPADRTVPHE